MSIIEGDITIVSGGQTVTFAPASASVDFDSLATEDSGRTDDGVMHIQFIKRRYRKVKITLPPMTNDEQSAILDLVLGRIYDITYRDPIKSGGTTQRTIRVYTSKGSANLYSGKILGGIWTGISFNAIEMSGEN